jgi:hypothetical protein
MASWKWRSVRRALLDKGFRLERSTNHEYYRLYVQGKASSVRTKVSHGSKGVGIPRQNGHPFHVIPAVDSTAFRPPIPRDSGRPPREG